MSDCRQLLGTPAPGFCPHTLFIVTPWAGPGQVLRVQKGPEPGLVRETSGGKAIGYNRCDYRPLTALKQGLVAGALAPQGN